jgi:SHS2 domain-containing protein
MELMPGGRLAPCPDSRYTANHRESAEARVRQEQTEMAGEEQLYETLDHTADIAVRVRSDTLPQLFENAAYALFDTLVELDGVAEAQEELIRVDGADLAELMVTWLNELLFLWESQLLLFKRFEVTELTDTRLTARAWGELFDEAHHTLLTEIKAATYHQLRVEKVGTRWSAQLIFDI